MHKVKFNSDKSNDKSNPQKQNKHGGGERDKPNETSFSQTKKH